MFYFFIGHFYILWYPSVSSQSILMCS